jgi:drug/metabolite transporter (DMT)-like permease
MKLDLKIWIMGGIAVLLGVFGFIFVTQAGQGLNVPQNDGYAVTGGVMLLLAGLIEGHVLGEVYDAGEKAKREGKK